MQILLTRDLDRAEFLQVRREPLRIEQGEAAISQPFHQGHQRDLRSVADMMKHRFAEERAADRNAVKTAGEFAILPGLDTMRVPEFVQPRVALDDLVVDPGLGALRAFAHDFSERNVHADLEDFFPRDALEGMRNVEFLEGENRARIGRKPFDFAVLHRHGKHAETISLEQDFRIDHGEVTSDM